MEQEQTPVVVSHADIYHKLGILEGKLDGVLGLSARVRSLEEFRWKLTGIALSGSAFITIGVNYFLDKI